MWTSEQKAHFGRRKIIEKCGGEVARYMGHYGTKRVANAVLVAAVPPIMLKSAANPEGLPIFLVEHGGLKGGRPEISTALCAGVGAALEDVRSEKWALLHVAMV
jgi:hypothetical protein